MSFDIHIIGAGRGGTSLVTGLIDAHPQCEIIPEIFSTNYLTGQQWTPAESEENPAVRVLLRIENFMTACREEAMRSQSPHWGHKTTTEHIMGLAALNAASDFANNAEAMNASCSFDFLGRFIEQTREVPTIFILRDGRTCVRSKMRRTGQPLETAIERWKFSIRVLSRFRQTARHLHVLKMEDLVLKPELELRAICEFLGIGYDSQMLEGTNSLKMLPEYRRSGLDLATIEVNFTAPWFDDIRSELLECGYTG